MTVTSWLFLGMLIVCPIVSFTVAYLLTRPNKKLRLAYKNACAQRKKQMAEYYRGEAIPGAAALQATPAEVAEPVAISSEVSEKPAVSAISAVPESAVVGGTVGSGMIMPGEAQVFIFEPEYDYWAEQADEELSETTKVSEGLASSEHGCPDVECEEGEIVNPELCICEVKDWECPVDIVCEENEIVDPYYCECVTILITVTNIKLK